MVILHIANISDSKVSGVSVVVPEHVRSQEKLETVGLLNIRDYRPQNIEHCFTYTDTADISLLSAPFDSPDLVVFHEVYLAPYLDISKQLRKRKIPYVIIPHGSLTHHAQAIKAAKKKVGNILFGSFFKNAVAIQCLSEHEMDETKFKLPKFVGTNGFDLPENKKSSFNTDKVIFTYVGRLAEYHKGIDILLDAFAMLSKTEYKDRCVLKMYGPDTDERYAHVKQMITERQLGDIVTLSPAIFGEEKERALLDTDIFVQTSRLEGMPMGILEALGYGIPCLVTDGTTMGDYVRKYNAGWSSVTDARAVFENLTLSIEEKAAYVKKSEGAVALITENFLWNKVSYDNIQAYRKFIDFGEK